jgi:hypothetical protein
LVQQWLLDQRLLLLGKSVYSLLQLYLPCSFLLDLLVHDLGSLHHHPSSGHVLLHESEVFIFNDDFNFLLRVLMLIILSFGFSMWVLIMVLLLLRQRR